MEIVRKCVEQIDVPFQLRGKQYFATSNWIEDFIFISSKKTFWMLLSSSIEIFYLFLRAKMYLLEKYFSN